MLLRPAAAASSVLDGAQVGDTQLEGGAGRDGALVPVLAVGGDQFAVQLGLTVGVEAAISWLLHHVT